MSKKLKLDKSWKSYYDLGVEQFKRLAIKEIESAIKVYKGYEYANYRQGLNDAIEIIKNLKLK